MEKLSQFVLYKQNYNHFELEKLSGNPPKKESKYRLTICFNTKRYLYVKVNLCLIVTRFNGQQC